MQKFKIYSFETLDVWKESRELVVRIYKLTSGFPNEEKFGLISQMRRAVISVSSNLAEGSSRQSLKDQARYSEISFGSLMELLSETILSFDLNFITDAEFFELRKRYDSIGSKLTGLKDSQIKRHEDKQTFKTKSTQAKTSFNAKFSKNKPRDS